MKTNAESEPRDIYDARRWNPPTETARLVGVSRRTIDRWIKSGLIRATKPGGGPSDGAKVFVDRDSVIALLEKSVIQ